MEIFFNLLLSIFVLLLIFYIISELKAIIYRKKLKVPDYIISHDDTINEAKRIARFLNERSTLCNKYFNKGTTEADDFDNKKFNLMLQDLNYNTIMFLRLCHSLGCEVVIRQIGTNDLEKKEITPKVFAEKVSKIDIRHLKKLKLPHSGNREISMLDA